jgi:hypothetical protein
MTRNPVASKRLAPRLPPQHQRRQSAQAQRGQHTVGGRAGHPPASRPIAQRVNLLKCRRLLLGFGPSKIMSFDFNQSDSRIG